MWHQRHMEVQTSQSDATRSVEECSWRFLCRPKTENLQTVGEVYLKCSANLLEASWSIVNSLRSCTKNRLIRATLVWGYKTEPNLKSTAMHITSTKHTFHKISKTFLLFQPIRKCAVWFSWPMIALLPLNSLTDECDLFSQQQAERALWGTVQTELWQLSFCVGVGSKAQR